MNALVSIIMPSYNASELISATIHSVLSQTYKNWELIVIDDCSKDSTCSVVQSFVAKDDRIRLIQLDKNYGAPAGPRNIGVKASNGEWIAFLDSDDIWHPDKLSIQMFAMNQWGVDFSSSLSRNFKDETNIVNDNVDIASIKCENISFAMQRMKGRIANSSVVVRKELMLKYPFNEDMRYKAVEDYHCWLRIHKAIDHSIKVQAVLLYYRIVEGQISGSKMYMLKAMFGLHKEFGGSSLPKAVFFTFTHALGGFINKFIKRGF